MIARHTLPALVLSIGLALGGPAAPAHGARDAQGAPESPAVLSDLGEHAAPAAQPSPSVLASSQGEPTLASQVQREAEAVRGMLAGGGVALVLLILLVGGLGYVGVARLIRAVSRSGYAVRRRLVALRVLVTGLIAIWGASVLVRQLLQRAPLLTMILLVLFVGGALLGLATRLQQAAGGIALVLRGRIREGDRLHTGEVTGTVEHAGLLRVQLLCADGATVYLPTSALDSQAVVISSPSRAQPVELPWRLDQPLDAAERARLLGIVTLCPYRVPGTALSVTVAEDDHRRLTVRLQAWSASAAERAEVWLTRSLQTRS